MNRAAGLVCVKGTVGYVSVALRKHSVNASRVAKFAAVLFLSCAMVFSLSGCKYTDVLTEHIQDQDNGTLDESQDPIYQEVPGAPTDPDLADAVIDSGQDVDTQVEKMPHYDPSAPDNGPTKARQNSDDTPHDEQASEGTEEGGSSSSDSGSGAEEGTSTGTGEETTSEQGDTLGDQSSQGGAGGSQAIVDTDGTTTDTASGTIAAVGEYATIVQMLGGAGALAAADQSWLDSVTAAGAFEGELSNVKVGWSGNGGSSGSCDVDAIISMHPRYVLSDGVEPALTSADTAALSAAGIEVLTVPRLDEATTEDDNVVEAVEEVASILNGVAGLQYDPSAMYESYVSFRNSVLKSASDANGGYSYKYQDGTNYHLYQDSTEYLTFSPSATNARVSVAFVDNLLSGYSSGTANQHYTATNGGATQQVSLGNDGKTVDMSDGVAVSATGSSYAVLDYYLQFAGIVNNAYDTDYPSSKQYLVLAGSIAGLSDSSTFASRTLDARSALWYAPNGDETNLANMAKLSDAAFPAVLARTEGIADAIAASGNKSNGLYHMDGSYHVYVVPSGLSGSWAYGNVESFLSSLWSLRVRDASNLSTAATTTKNFYATFYRCNDWSDAVSDFYYDETAG